MTLQRFTRDVIEKIANIAHAEQPAVCRCSRSFKDGIGPSLNCPIPPFKRVLILMVGFRVPTTAMVHSEYIFDLLEILLVPSH